MNLPVLVVLSTSEWCLFTGILPLKRHSFWIIHSKVLCAQHKCHLGKWEQSGVGDWRNKSSSKHTDLHICRTYVMLCQFAYPSIEMNDTCFAIFGWVWCLLILNIWKNSLGIHSQTIETSKSLPSPTGLLWGFLSIQIIERKPPCRAPWHLGILQAAFPKRLYDLLLSSPAKPRPLPPISKRKTRRGVGFFPVEIGGCFFKSTPKEKCLRYENSVESSNWSC